MKTNPNPSRAFLSLLAHRAGRRPESRFNLGGPNQRFIRTPNVACVPRIASDRYRTFARF